MYRDKTTKWEQLITYHGRCSFFVETKIKKNKLAQRRMLDKSIISSAKFVKMQQETQNLYFHLVMNADDDGVVEAFTIMRMIGATEDSLRVLNAKNFVKILNEDLVSFVNDWLTHNKIRADRKIDSKYKDLLLEILPETFVLKAKTRADRGNVNTGVKGRPKKGTEKGRHRLGKVRLGKVRLGKDIYNELSYEKIFKQTYKTKQDIADKKGIKLKKLKRTPKQRSVVDGLRMTTYFRDKGQELHGMQFLTGNESRNGAIRKLIIRASEKVDIKGLIDWWLDGAGEWADYEPEQCFSSKITEKFRKQQLENKDYEKIILHLFKLKKWKQEKGTIFNQFKIPAKNLLELCEDNFDEANNCLDKIAKWADSHDLDWSINTVFKKWYDIDHLKLKEKKPFIGDQPVFQKNGKWYLIDRSGEIKEYVGAIKDIKMK